MKKNRIIKLLNEGQFWVVIFSLLFGGWLLFGTFSYKNDQFIISSKVWSDFAAHIPLIRSFSFGSNFPPEYPLFPNEPIRYHYLFYFFVAMLEKIGVNIAISLNLFSTLGFSLLLLMIFKITKLFFNSKKAGYLAIYLFLFNGSLSFVKYFEKNGLTLSSLKNIFFESSFVSFGPWDGGVISAFWNLNIYTNQRHLALGIGLFLFGIYPLLSVIVKKKKFVLKRKIKILLFFVFLFLPLINQAGYVALLGFVLGIIGIYFTVILFKRHFFQFSIPKKIIFLYVFYFLVSLIIPLFFSTYGESNISLEIGFLSREKDLFSLIGFWFQNIGFYIFFIFLIPIWLITKKSLKYRAIIFISFLIYLSFFLLANLFKLSADMINNHKLINIFMIGMNILVAGLLTELWEKKFHRILIVFFLILTLTFSGIIDLFPILNDKKYNLDDVGINETSQWIKKNTSGDSIFLTTSYLYNPASLAGRKIFLDYGYFAWSLGYNDAERRSLLPVLFSVNKINKIGWCNLMNTNNLGYVIISPDSSDLGTKIIVEKSFIVKNIQPEFISKDNYRIYNVEKYCYEK